MLSFNHAKRRNEHLRRARPLCYNAAHVCQQDHHHLSMLNELVSYNNITL